MATPDDDKQWRSMDDTLNLARAIVAGHEAGTLTMVTSVNEDRLRFAKALIEFTSARSATATNLPADILAMCKQRGWNLHWTHRGAYLHLESSELIEALRGKRGDPLHEAADVLLVLMSITENAGLPWDAVMQTARETCESLKTRPRYPGEEHEPESYVPGGSDGKK